MARPFSRLKRFQPVVAYSASVHLETVFISAIATLLVIRLLLKLTGYPQLGGGGLHIAHVLYGGLFMLASIVVLLNYLGDRARSLAALLGGIGLGFFIDELGKFITSDNDYFFKPSVLFIYTFFLLLWFVIRRVSMVHVTSRKARIANVLELLQEGLIFGFNAEEKATLDELLKKIDDDDELGRQLAVLSTLIQKRARDDEPNWYAKLSDYAVKNYLRLVRWSHFTQLLFIIFMIQGLLSLSGSLQAVLEALASGNFDISDALLGVSTGQLAGALIYAYFVLLGLYRLQTTGELRNAFLCFRTALLFNIFVTQFFAFYELQFAAVFSLALNLLLLATVNYLLQLERHTSHHHDKLTQSD